MRISAPTDIRRTMAAFGLLLHLLLVGAGPALDARLEVTALQGSQEAAHVHGDQATLCGSVHQHEVCLIQAMGAMELATIVTRVRSAAEFAAEGIEAPADLDPSQPQRPSHGARAPPLA